MNYRDEVLRTGWVNRIEMKDRLALGAMGLSGESGEVTDLLKKHLFHGKSLDRAKLIEELGDVRWYLEYLCIALDVCLADIEAVNILKLRKRYPEGFSFEAANAPREAK